MGQSSLDWGVFCSPSSDYADKVSWVESLCQTLGARNYSPTAEEITWLQIMFTGLKWHFVVFFGALVLSMFLGTFLGVIRTTSNKWLAGLGNVYVEIFRNVPLVLQYFFWLLVFPSFLPATFSPDSNADVSGLWYRQIAATSPWVMGILGLGLYHAARISEQVRAGIQTIPTGQWNASRALGMSNHQIYSTTILPQSFRLVWPTLTSEVMNIFKNASVAFVVSVANFYAQTKSMIELTSQDTVILVLSTMVYLLFTYMIKVLMAWIEDYIRIPGVVMGGRRHES